MKHEIKYRIESIHKMDHALSAFGAIFELEKQVIDIYFAVPDGGVVKIIEEGRSRTLIELKKRNSGFDLVQNTPLQDVEAKIAELSEKYGVKAVLHRTTHCWSYQGMEISTHHISGRGDFLIFTLENDEDAEAMVSQCRDQLNIKEEEKITVPFSDLPETGEVRLQTHVAVFVFLVRENKIFLIERANTGYMDGFFGLPSGHAQEAESLYSAAIREAEEEAGVHIKKENLKHIHTRYRNRGRAYMDIYFMCEEWEGEPFASEKEKSGICGWFADTEFPEKTVAYVFQAWSEYKKGNPFSEEGSALIK